MAPQLVLLACAAGLGVSVANSLVAFITTYGVHAGLDQRTAGLLLAGDSALGLGVRIFLGWLADRIVPGLRTVALVLMVSAAGPRHAGNRMVGPGGRRCDDLVRRRPGRAGLFNFLVVQEHAPADTTAITQSGVYADAGLGPLLVGLRAGQVSFAAA